MDKETKVMTELSYIIARMDKNLKAKIPFSLRKEISKKKDNTYMINYDKNLPLYKQKLLDDTKALLSVIYSQYLCSDFEKEKWEKFDEYKKSLLKGN